MVLLYYDMLHREKEDKMKESYTLYTIKKCEKATNIHGSLWHGSEAYNVIDP